MTTQYASQSVTNGSLGLVWTLVSRAVGLTAGLAIGMLLLAALVR